MKTIKQVNYKGAEIKIYQDLNFQETPDTWENNDLFLVNYHRDFYIERPEVVSKNEVKAYYRNQENELENDYYVFELSCLVRSGVWLKLNKGFSCDPQGWDTSYVGVVLANKKEFESREKAKKSALGLIETWNYILRGDIYGYNSEINGQEIGSCWGFIGEIEKSGLLKEAKAEIDYFLKDKKDYVISWTKNYERVVKAKDKKQAKKIAEREVSENAENLKIKLK